MHDREVDSPACGVFGGFLDARADPDEMDRRTLSDDRAFKRSVLQQSDACMHAALDAGAGAGIVEIVPGLGLSSRCPVRAGDGAVAEAVTLTTKTAPDARRSYPPVGAATLPSNRGDVTGRWPCHYPCPMTHVELVNPQKNLGLFRRPSDGKTNTLNSSSSVDVPPLQISQAGTVIRSVGRGGMKRFFGGTWSLVVAIAPQNTHVFGVMRNCSLRRLASPISIHPRSRPVTRRGFFCPHVFRRADLRGTGISSRDVLLFIVGHSRADAHSVFQFDLNDRAFDKTAPHLRHFQLDDGSV